MALEGSNTGVGDDSSLQTLAGMRPGLASVRVSDQV